MPKSIIFVTGDNLNGPEVLLDCSALEFPNDSQNSCLFCPGNPILLKGIGPCLDSYDDYSYSDDYWSSDLKIKFTYEKYNSTLQSCLRDGLERKKLQYEVLNLSFLQFELFITRISKTFIKSFSINLIWSFSCKWPILRSFK